MLKAYFPKSPSTVSSLRWASGEFSDDKSDFQIHKLHRTSETNKLFCVSQQEDDLHQKKKRTAESDPGRKARLKMGS